MQHELIDITHWPEDQKFSAAYPEGARPKHTVFSPESPKELFIKPRWRHMFKRSSGRYPDQYWAEIVAYQIALLMEVAAPPCYAAYDENKGQCGALSPWFYDDEKEYFFSAGSFFHKHIENFDRDTGLQHNLVDADKFNNRVLGRNQIYDFWSMMLFDIVIGNTDRHQDNWGHILNPVKFSKSVASRKGDAFDVRWRFAPWFDNGTSLGHELLPTKFNAWDSSALDRYIGRGKHHLRYSINRLERIGHLKSLELLSNLPAVKQLLMRKIKRFDAGKLEKILMHYAHLNAPYSGNLTEARAEIMLKLTKRRLELAGKILNEHH